MGPFVDQLIASEAVDSLTSEGEIHWPITDQVGTLRDVAVLDGIIGSFEIETHRVYNSFGLLTGEFKPAIDPGTGLPTGTGTPNSIDLDHGFTGKFHDDLTGLTHHQNRWFDPQLGKWISEDPLGFAAGDINTTRYVSNSPLLSTDPTGLYATGVQGTYGGLNGDGGDTGTHGVLAPLCQGQDNVYIFVISDEELNDLFNEIEIPKPTINIPPGGNPFNPFAPCEIFPVPPRPTPPSTPSGPGLIPPWEEGLRNPGISGSKILRAIFEQIRIEVSGGSSGGGGTAGGIPGFPGIPTGGGRPGGGVIRIRPIGTEIPIGEIFGHTPTITITPGVDEDPDGPFIVPEVVPGVGGQGFGPTFKIQIELRR